MKNLLTLFLLLPFFAIGQTQDPCYSINDVYTQIGNENPPIEINLVSGWNMFGFPCSSQMNVEEAFSTIIENVIVIKDNYGNAYLPEWSFNGIGELISGDGYQAKLTNSADDFTFCEGVILPDINELSITNYVQQTDSIQSNSFYLGILDSTQYSIEFYTTSSGSASVYSLIEILSPTELVNAKYIAVVDVEVNGVQQEIYATQLASNHMEWYLSNSINNGDIIDFTVVTSSGIFTIREEVFITQTQGCIDSTALNYNPLANSEDGYCFYSGCTDEAYLEYNDMAIEDDGSCANLSVACPYDIYIEYNSIASNYNESVCTNLIVEGCTNYSALNYNWNANLDDGTCQYIYGCTQQEADNYNAEATTDDGSCFTTIEGCTDPTAGNYDETANTDDGSCLIGGCMNTTAENYNADASIDDGTCVIYGCTLSIFPNYNSVATIGDGSCDMNSLDVYGCTDSLAFILNINANIDNGTCRYYPIVGDITEGGYLFYVDETGEHGLVAAFEDIGQFAWCSSGTSISGADGTAIGTGYQNTLDIVAGCSASTSIAASEALAYESGGYSDWYLPSKDELVEMYNTIGNGGPEGNIGGFSNDWYWSSSEYYYRYYAWGVSFGNGDTDYDGKNDTGRVRVIRAF